MMYRLYGAITVLIFFAVIVVNDLAGGDWGRAFHVEEPWLRRVSCY